MDCKKLTSGTLLLGALALVALGAALGPRPALAQEESPGVFGEIIDVRVVNLEVVVTDRRGNRVTDLRPEDFRLLVDGQETSIEYFTEVLGGTAKAAPGEGPSAVPSAVPGKTVGTSYLVFIDDFFAVQRDRNRVLDGLKKQLSNLGPDDRMAIVAFDGRTLTMLSSWTNLTQELERALRQASMRPALGLQRIAEKRNLLSTRGLLLNLGEQEFSQYFQNVGVRLSSEERSYVALVQSQVERQVAAASATLRSFAMPPGRKVMMVLSGGWPFDPPQATAENQEQPVLDSEFKRGYNLFRPLVDTANLLGYTLYPVDVPGLRPDLPSAETMTVAINSQPSAISEEREAETSLQYLADRTGGRALLNSANIRALATVSQDTLSYYWLGFSPDRRWDDEEHRIKVEVVRPGLRVRARKSFLDLSRQQEVSALVESTLLFGNTPQAGGLPVQLGEPRKSGRRRVDLPISIAIPIQEITVLPVGGRYVSELELRIAVMDEDGNQADIPVLPVRLETKEEPPAGAMVRYDTSVQLRKLDHDLVISIYDPASGRLLTNRVSVDI